MPEEAPLMLKDYFQLKQRYPALFANAGGPFQIISDPVVIHKWQDERRPELRRDGSPEEWADIGVLCDDPYVLVIRDLVQFPGGARRGYIRISNRADLSGGQGVAILACKDDRLLLLRQFRHATRSWHLEIPRGFGEPGVPAAQQADDELREEVGAQIRDLVDLGIVHSNTGLEGDSVRLFFARLLSAGEPAREEGIHTLLWVSLPELESLIRDGTITDGFTMAAYARARLTGVL